jgi:hypothetical protein
MTATNKDALDQLVALLERHTPYDIVHHNASAFVVMLPALVADAKRAAALEAAVRKVETKRDDFIHETHSYDPSTNAWECSNEVTTTYVEALDDALEILGKPHAPAKLTCATCATGPVPNAAHCRDCRIHDALVVHWTPQPQPSGSEVPAPDAGDN